MTSKESRTLTLEHITQQMTSEEPRTVAAISTMPNDNTKQQSDTTDATTNVVESVKGQLPRVTYSQEQDNLKKVVTPCEGNIKCEASGYVVIINNYNFQDKVNNLPGSEQDTGRLKETFDSFNFKVDIDENKTGTQMHEIWMDYANKDYTGHSLFVCILSSHGVDETILGTDNTNVRLMKMMKSVINCPSLNGKPKLFFIDACQKLKTEELTASVKNNGEFIVCYSTLKDKIASQNSKQCQGSIFFNSICDIFQLKGADTPIHELLQMVKHAVNEVSKGSQIVETQESLTKVLYFVQKRKYELLVAIDFGTSLSGYAYSTYDEFKKCPLNISCERCWNSRNMDRHSQKTPTCILLDSKSELVSFGYDAMTEFADLHRKGIHAQYFLFQNFKVQLYNKTSLNNLVLLDVQGKHMPAKNVFKCSILALKNKFIEQLKLRGLETTMSEIRWVLTVPAIWSEDSKLFMRECAHQAGLPRQLLIALETEAASIYCQSIRMVRGEDLSTGFKVPDHERINVVVDVGGGKTDITIHKRTKSGDLEELLPATGDNIGGSSIESKLIELLKGIFKNNLLQRLKDERVCLYNDLLCEIEHVKKLIKPSQQGMVPVRIPLHTLNNMLAKQNKTIENIIESKMSGKVGDEKTVELEDEKLLINVNEIKKVFDPIISKILETIQVAVKNTANIQSIILVGGFAESTLFQAKVKEFFEPRKIPVIVPEDASHAVLKGAVLFGHNPAIIGVRNTRFTYGVGISDKLVPLNDYIKRNTTDLGNTRCRECYDLIVPKNTVVSLGKSIAKSYVCFEKRETSIVFNIYMSEEVNPVYTDKGKWTKILTFEVELPNPSETHHNVEIEFIFYDTELKIKTKEMLHGKQREIDCKLVS